MLDRQWDDFHVFAGAETFLLANMRHGGAGCISATANVNPGAIHRLYETWQDDDAETQQAELDALRAIFMQFPVIPALKATVARFTKDQGWAKVRPPLVDLDEDAAAQLAEQLDAYGFAMPGLGDR